MGGSSSDSTSTTEQKISTTNQQADAQGVVGTVFQGQQVDYSYSNDFTPEVAAQFSKLENLTGEAGAKALDIVSGTFNSLFGLTEKALDIAKDTGATALQEINASKAASANPEVAASQKYIPFAIIGFVGLIVVLLLRKK